METVSIKLQGSLAKAMGKAVREFNYSTKTEFIREALRLRIQELERERAWDALFAARGSLKGKGRFKTYEELHDWRSGEGSRELMEYYRKKFGANQK